MRYGGKKSQQKYMQKPNKKKSIKYKIRKKYKYIFVIVQCVLAEWFLSQTLSWFGGQLFSVVSGVLHVVCLV